MATNVAVPIQPQYRQSIFSPAVIPTLPLLSLQDDEKQTIARLQARWIDDRLWMLITDSYYRGMQIIANLGISIPPELAVLRTIVGWPRIAVDPYVERLFLDSFRLADATDADETLSDILAANGFDAEQSLAYVDALVQGRGWFTVGSPDEPGGAPRICVESPLNMVAEWNARRKITAAMQFYWQTDRWYAALYMPNKTVQMGQDENFQWQVTDRDQHNFGDCSVRRLANQPRTYFRDGASEITPELMSLVDAACRSILGLEVAAEFYSLPQKAILGASESDFQNADGTTKSAWSTYINHILALERDEDGNLPELHQFTAYDPSVYTKVVEMFASQAAGILAAPPQDLGLYTEGNPISAEAQQVSENRRDRRAVLKQRQYSPTLVDVAQLAMRYANRGTLPDAYRRIACDWMPPQMLNLAATTDAITKQVQTGIIPAESDVTLKRLGYSAIERRRIEQDRQLGQGDQLLRQLAGVQPAESVSGDGANAAAG